ncbi:MAG: hypothetical protein HXY50_00485 [Ignavibacteriaceae bacterium]|nr:hypothetical protein [Ignavibacteriaceae bacterium]
MLKSSLDGLAESEISLYGHGKVSIKVLTECVIKLKKSFPKLPIGFYDVLEQLLDEEKFTDKRLIDATNNLIKTCQYPEPTIANILGYDKKIKIYTWDELAKISCDYGPEARKRFWDQYGAIKISEQSRYVLKEFMHHFTK